MPQDDISASGPWALPWWGRDSMAWMQPWSSAFALAPQTLNQPILPGMTVGPVVNINSNNSSAPQTEAEVLQRHSYGRQLGRMADALAVLLAERGPRAKAEPAVEAFESMKREIDAVKLDAAQARIDRLLADLAALRTARPADYRRLRAALRKALDAA